MAQLTQLLTSTIDLTSTHCLHPRSQVHVPLSFQGLVRSTPIHPQTLVRFDLKDKCKQQNPYNIRKIKNDFAYFDIDGKVLYDKFVTGSW